MVTPNIDILSEGRVKKTFDITMKDDALSEYTVHKLITRVENSMTEANTLPLCNKMGCSLYNF